MKRTTRLILLGVLWCYREEWIELQERFPGVNTEVYVKEQRWKGECFTKKKMFQNHEKSTIDQLRKCKMKVLLWPSQSPNQNNNRKSHKYVLRLSWEPETLAGMAEKSSKQESKDLLLQKTFPKQVLLSSLPNHAGCPNIYLRLLSSFVFIGQQCPFVNSLERMHSPYL